MVTKVLKEFVLANKPKFKGTTILKELENEPVPAKTIVVPPKKVIKKSKYKK